MDKGYNQVKGVDYKESFSLIVKNVTIRLIFTVVAVKAWPLHPVDINNAFLHGFLMKKSIWLHLMDLIKQRKVKYVGWGGHCMASNKHHDSAI